MNLVKKHRIYAFSLDSIFLLKNLALNSYIYRNHNFLPKKIEIKAYSNSSNSANHSKSINNSKTSVFEIKNEFSKSYEKSNGKFEDTFSLVMLTDEQRISLLPLIPSSSQLKFYFGDFVLMAYLFGLGFGTSVILSMYLPNEFLVSLFFFLPLWAPILLAIRRNLSFIRYKFAGTWNSTVLEVLEIKESSYFTNKYSLKKDHSKDNRRLLKLVVGDLSGAEAELIVPWNIEYLKISIGETARLIVLSKNKNIKKFKVLKEIYLPNSGIWVTSYPLINKTFFENL